MKYEPKYFKVLEKNTVRNRGKVFTRYRLRYSSSVLSGGSCAGFGDAMFPNTDTYSKEEERIFERVCTDCPIMEACLEWGLAHETFGIWGGTTPKMRAAIRKQMGIEFYNLTSNT